MPHVEIPSAEIKVVLLGSSHTGKSSLVTRFAHGYYRADSRRPTVGASFQTKRLLSSHATSVKVQIWDTAGSDGFKPMARMFYRDASAVVVCYDVTDRRSFEEMRGWLDELRRDAAVGEVVVAIAALKADLLEDDNNKSAETDGFVPEGEAEQLADALGVMYVPTSAKNNYNVNALFQRVADRVLENRKEARIHKLNDKHHADDETMDTFANHVPHHETSAEVRQTPPSTMPSNGSGNRPSERRSKYDKQYRINTDVDTSASSTPTRAPKSSSKRRTKSTVDSTKKKGSSSTGTSSRSRKKKESLLQDENDASRSNNEKPFGCCQPVVCGAGEGMEDDSGCIMS